MSKQEPWRYCTLVRFNGPKGYNPIFRTSRTVETLRDAEIIKAEWSKSWGKSDALIAEILELYTAPIEAKINRQMLHALQLMCAAFMGASYQGNVYQKRAFETAQTVIDAAIKEIGE